MQISMTRMQEDPNGCGHRSREIESRARGRNLNRLTWKWGGSLTVYVVDMVGLFIKDGPVVQVKGRDEKASILTTGINRFYTPGHSL